MSTVGLEEKSLQGEHQIARSTLAPPLDSNWSLADLQNHLGGIPLDRIRLDPSPGHATEQDFLIALNRKTFLAELIDGTLVDKALGLFDSRLASELGFRLEEFSYVHKSGATFGPNCPVRLLPGQIRLPDSSFVEWSRFPGRRLPTGDILDIAPDIAIEVISPSNTAAEMDRKLEDYFRAGVRLVWYVYPITITIRVYKSPTDSQELKDDQFLNGGDVLPGFELSVKTLFDRAMGI